jgi:hypothetical protein
LSLDVLTQRNGHGHDHEDDPHLTGHSRTIRNWHYPVQCPFHDGTADGNPVTGVAFS